MSHDTWKTISTSESHMKPDLPFDTIARSRKVVFKNFLIRIVPAIEKKNACAVTLLSQKQSDEFIHN